MISYGHSLRFEVSYKSIEPPLFQGTQLILEVEPGQRRHGRTRLARRLASGNTNANYIGGLLKKCTNHASSRADTTAVHCSTSRGTCAYMIIIEFV